MPDPSSAKKVREDAQGALREVVGALGNLQQLLGTRNVGPKAIAKVLPDLRVECNPLMGALAPLLDSPEAAATAPCCNQLKTLIAARVERLEEALAGAQRRQLNAKSRLKLETTVRQVVRDLGGALTLLELVADAQEPGGCVDWIEALRLSRSGDQSQAPGTLVVSAELRCDSQLAMVGVRPRTALNLVRLASSLVFDRSQPLGLQFAKRNERETQLRIHRGSVDDPEGAAEIELLLPRAVDATGGCLHGCARALAIQVELQPTEILMTWDEASVPEATIAVDSRRP